jgi:hypothetical protein
VPASADNARRCCGRYNTNKAHYAEANTVAMRDAMEPLLYKYVPVS